MHRSVCVLAAACALVMGLGAGGLHGGGKGGDAKEGKKSGPTPSIKNWYELRYLPYADNYVLMRFERYSGRTWVFTALRWQEIEESTRVPPGQYDIKLVPVARSDSPREYRAFRIEQETGLTWILTTQKWEEIKERE